MGLASRTLNVKIGSDKSDYRHLALLHLSGKRVYQDLGHNFRIADDSAGAFPIVNFRLPAIRSQL